MRAAAQKVVKPKTAFQKVGAFFSNLFRKKAKVTPGDGGDEAELATPDNGLTCVSVSVCPPAYLSA